MNLFVGLDVSQKKTAVCVVDASGAKVCQASIETSPQAIYQFLVEKGFTHSKIGMETGPLAVWLYHGLQAFGLQIDCIHARHVHAALTMQLNKTDRNDAFGIARLVQSGWYRPTHVKSLQCHQLRLVLTAREKLVQIRVTLINQIRGLLKTFGVVLPAGRNSVFERSVVESSPSIAEVKPTVLMLMQTLKDIGTQVRALDKKLLSFTRTDVVCKLLTSIPGVGTLTAISFKTAIDDPERFGSVSDAGAFLGLTPKKYQSGEVDRNAGISKHGCRQTRSLLYEAATCLLTRYGKDTTLAAWGKRLWERLGFKKAVVALARKLSAVMLSMWKSGELYREARAIS